MSADAYWHHDDLVKDLYQHFVDAGQCVFAEPKLGSHYLNNGTCPMPDIYTFKKSYTRTDIHAIEIKAHRSDLLSDIRNAKWEKYQPYCDRVSFALAPGIEWKDVLDHQPVGIMVRNEKGWRTLRAAPRHGMRQPIPEEVWLSLFFSHTKFREESNRRTG